MKKTKTDSPFSKGKGLKIFGIGKQEFIKFFFGGNAVISIIALILISLLLVKEAVYFFPDYKTNLNIYRQSGKEFADIAKEQLKYQEEIASLTTNLKQYEIFHRAGADAYIPQVFVGFQNIAREQMREEILNIKTAKERIDSKEIIWEIWAEDEDPEKQALAKTQQAEAEQKLTQAQDDLTVRIQEIAKKIKISDLTPQLQSKAHLVKRDQPEAIQKLKDTLTELYSRYATDSSTPKYIKTISARGSAKRSELAQQPLFQQLSGIEKVLYASDRDYTNYINRMRDQTLAVSERSYAFLSSAAKKRSIEQGIPEATPEKRRSLEIELERLVTEDQDYDALAQNVYVTIPEHDQLIEQMMNVTTPEFAKLPELSEFTNRGAREFHKELQESVEGYEEFMLSKNQQLKEWRHDDKIGFFKTLTGFIFGKEWVANSSWHNFFGLRPLFGGSLFITLIAISIATPFAVGAAIYVNRLSNPLEQTIIKPILEFIQAIPSVVLAFLGVVIVGQTILKISYTSWLEWVPGFPALGEQMMLTAGVLLAFMAIPTMFTLAEDAINNVPKSYYEASLALGASKLETVFRVIIPSALSGIVAAVILGFGRIIGETMVVLLVAGGTIAWPEKITSPVHTMTGLIAQSTGEAAPGSIQYRALFLVGFVLFLISLVLNSLAQAFIKRYGNKG